jgi:hypothetical protein
MSEDKLLDSFLQVELERGSCCQIEGEEERISFIICQDVREQLF